MLFIEGLYSILGIVTPHFLLLARGTQAFRVFSHMVGLNVSNLLESKAAFIHLRTVLVMLTGRIDSFIVCSAIFFILFVSFLFYKKDQVFILFDSPSFFLTKKRNKTCFFI